MRTNFVFTTEMTDGLPAWATVRNLLIADQPVVVYTKGVLNLDQVELISKHRGSLSVTITGWGGTWLESRVPPSYNTIPFLYWAKEILGNKLRLRIDPVVPTTEGFRKAFRVAELVPPLRCTTSIIQKYKGHDLILSKLGLSSEAFTIKSGNAWFVPKRTAEHWFGLLQQANPELASRTQFCGMPYQVGALHTGCIDDDLLRDLGVTKFTRVVPGVQRPGCRCVIRKRQIRGTCSHGCAYCYANKQNAYSPL